VLRATEDTWVRVRQNDGSVLVSRILKAGETWPVPAEPDLILDTGNTHGLEVDVDGVPTRLGGAVVIHNVPIDANLLVSGTAARLGH
jgi:cytoskeleton protein RodZ